MEKLISYNPATREIVGWVKFSTKPEIKKAIKTSKQAFIGWRNLSVETKIGYIRKFKIELLKQKQKIARLISLEMGKPYLESLDEVDWISEHLDYFIKKWPKFLGSKKIDLGGKRKGKVVFEPYGVCAVITPWNFPVGLPILGIVPNIIVGNTVVFKPSEYTSLSGKSVVEIFKKIGLPKGVVNILFGNDKVGRVIIAGLIDLVKFTGSSKVGQEIYKKCGKKFIPCLLELGGSSPGIVFADADIKNALENIYSARFFNCGQVCVAVKRLFVEKSIFSKFVSKMVDKVSKAKIGDPFSEVDSGPLISRAQLNLLISQVKDAIKKGAKVEIGGKQPKGRQYEKGNFFLPTILTSVNFRMRVLKEEVFGPVLPIIPFKTEEEAIKMANDTSYGLSAEIYTSDLAKAKRVAGQLASGTVAINTNNYGSPASPFGGYKKSGIGREGGEFGFYELVQIKYICQTR